MNFVTTKQRILQYIENKGISTPIFFAETGLKRGFLDTDKLNGVVSDVFLAKIIATYPEINLHWLITGKGEMLTKIEEKESNKQTVENLQHIVAEPTKDYKTDLIESLKEQVIDLKKDKELLRSLLENKMGNAKMA